MNIRESIEPIIILGGIYFLVFYIRALIKVISESDSSEQKISFLKNNWSGILDGIIKMIRGSGIFLSGLNDIMLVISILYVSMAVITYIALIFWLVISGVSVFSTEAYFGVKKFLDHVFDYGLAFAIGSAIGYGFRGFIAPVLQKYCPSFFESPLPLQNKVAPPGSRESKTDKLQ